MKGIGHMRRLNIELVPQPLWNMSLNKTLKQSEWRKLRAKIIEQQNNRCAICGVINGEDVLGYDGLPHKTRLSCHEVWEYDDDNHIQILTGFLTVCSMCSNCIHIGMAGVLASQGYLDMDAVVKHYTTINDCSVEDFNNDRRSAMKLWNERSIFPWTQDISYYTERKYEE